MPAGATAGIRSGEPGWIAPNRTRRVWHYTRHAGSTVCGNHPVRKSDQRHDEPVGVRGGRICRRCEARKAGSRPRHFYGDWREDMK